MQVCLPHGHKASPEERIYGSPHFPEIATFSQIKEASVKLLSVSVE